jgi:hypothetical protein
MSAAQWHSAWQLADGIELFADLDPAAAPAEADGRCLGAVVARPHLTGWFFSAHHRADLGAEELAHFAEFARVRVYLLLTEGPKAATWAPGAGDDDWVAWSREDHLDLADAIPDAVPAHWR